MLGHHPTFNVQVKKFDTYHSRDSEVTGVHLVSQPVDFPASVAEDDGLSDRERLIEIAQCVQLPVLPTNKNPKFLFTHITSSKHLQEDHTR